MSFLLREMESCTEGNIEHIFALLVTNDIKGNEKRIEDPEAKETQPDTDYHQTGDMYLRINPFQAENMYLRINQSVPGYMHS